MGNLSFIYGISKVKVIRKVSEIQSGFRFENFDVYYTDEHGEIHSISLSSNAGKRIAVEIKDEVTGGKDGEGHTVR